MSHARESSTGATRAAATYTWQLTVDHQSPYFRGHFPGHPVFPGAAALLEFILKPLHARLPDLGPLRSLRRVKFRRMIPAAQTLDVQVTFADEPHRAQAQISCNGEICLTAGLVFDER